MYEVYSQTRPGRPRWAMAACALLLLLTLALAAMLSAGKIRGNRVSLKDESEVFPAGRVRVRMPADWNREKTRLSALPGVAAEAYRFSGGIAAGSHPTGEGVVVFRGLPRRNGIPSIDAAESLREMTQLVQLLQTQGKGGDIIEDLSEPARMGSLPGWTLEYSPDSHWSSTQLHYLGRAALAPDGQIAAILLTCPRAPNEEDRNLLENMSRSLELTDLLVADKPEEVMKAAGITFTPPAGTRFFVTTGDKPLPVPRVRLVGGEGRTTWYLEAARVPLVGSRKAAQLVEMHARTLLEKLTLPSPIQTGIVGKRSTAQLTLTVAENANPTVLLWGAEIDEQTGLLLVGRYESDGEAPLRAAAEAVTTGAIDSIKTTLDLTEAQAAARRVLQEIAAEGLGSFWAGKSVETARMVAPLIAARKEVRTYEAVADKDGSRWWQIKVTYLPSGPSVRLTADIQEEWRIRDDGASHDGLYHEIRSRRKSIEYEEQHLAGSNEVLCELASGEEEPARWAVPVDDTYACESVLIAAGSKLARNPKAGPAVFAATENYCPQLIRWIMTPIGDRPLPGLQDGKTAPAVCLTRDYSPMPIVFYYGQDGSVMAVSFDGVIWQERMDEGDNPRPEPPRRGRSR